jgi:hypothetical protein
MQTRTADKTPVPDNSGLDQASGLELLSFFRAID